MQRKDIILFGASKMGEIAYIMLKDKYNIIYYCDNDKTKMDKYINGIKIISVSELMQINNKTKIIISSDYYREISKQLTEMGINNFEIFSLNINPYSESSSDCYSNMKEVNLGRFLKSLGDEISFNNLTFISGGSGVLDYAFLKAIAIKFKITSYLEIGSYIGESMDAVSSVVSKCYSISLPDEELEEHFANKGMNNFSSYFMHRNRDIGQYKGDSKEFDYILIDKDIQLVFIDGDHSYTGVYKDTRNIFNFINTENTIVVWHDFKTNGEYRLPVINAVFDALPEKYHDNIYSVDNNICGIYIPSKYIDSFEFNKDKDKLYSYEVKLKIKENRFI